MKLSTKGRYGLRAVIDLALTSENEAVSISSIAARQSLLGKLSGAAHGQTPQGRHRQKHPGRPGRIPSGTAAGGNLCGRYSAGAGGRSDPVDCMALKHKEGGCVGQDACVTRYVWQKISDSINETVDGILLSTLLEESRQKAGCRQGTCDL